MSGQPLYPIGIVAEILGVSPETLRVWDRQGIVKPQRWRGFRCYSDPDLQRLLFVKHLLDDEGFNLAGVRGYLKLYPCWSRDDCVPRHKSTSSANGKPCWKRSGAYCGLAEQQSSLCKLCAEEQRHTTKPPFTLREKAWASPIPEDVGDR